MSDPRITEVSSTTNADPPRQNPDPYYDDDESISISPVAIINFLLRRHRLILVCFLVATVGAYVFSKLSTPVYEATVKFLTDPKAASRVLSTTEAYGIETRNPLDYLSAVVKSSSVLDRVLAHKFESHGGATLIELLELSEIPGQSADARQGRARQVVKDGGMITLATASSKDPSFLSLKAQWDNPDTAAELANVFTDALRDYDRQIKSAVARTKREFIERQLTENQKLLKAAEEEVRNFRVGNRMLVWQALAGSAASAAGGGGGAVRVASPDLQLQADRLERESKIQSEQFSLLKHELELAKIAEANDSSSIVIVERATPPAGRVKPTTRTNVLLGAMLGLMLGIGLAFVIEFASKMDKETDDMRELMGHVSAVRGGIKKLASSFALPPSHDYNDKSS
ncbi:hypothetical protein D4R30_00510 [archaeon]|nr:MAG: hypothetical protein D4R30_00510 [archaeon]